MDDAGSRPRPGPEAPGTAGAPLRAGALLALALPFAALLAALWWLPPYGLFHDELYYWANAQRLGLGYVDHPPLAPWLLRASTALLGDGPAAFALVPALCAAGTVLLTGAMAQRLGAGRSGQLLAGLCVAVQPFAMVMFSFFSVNAVEYLLWTAACFLLLEIARTRDERLWLALGAVAGLALLNKHTFLLLGAGLGVGVLATPLRAELRRRGPWLGLALALALALPNLLWNAANDWPSLAFYRSRHLLDVPTGVGEALAFQLKAGNPVAALVWAPGAAFLLLARRARPYRPLGVAFLLLLVGMLLSGQRRGDRVAAVYPVAFAAGAAFWALGSGRVQRWARRALPALLLAYGAAAAAVALPLLPPETVARYLGAIDERPTFEAHDLGEAVPLHLTGRLDWDRFAGALVEAVAALPPELRERAVVLTHHWVEAATVEYYGRAHELPPVVSPHNAYWLWREEAAGRDVAVSIGIPAEALRRWFGEVRRVGAYRCRVCTRWRGDAPVLVATGPQRPLVELLEEWRHFGLLPAPALRVGTPEWARDVP